MTSNHLNSDGPGLTALKNLFDKTGFVFQPANKDVYKLWVTVGFTGEHSDPQTCNDYRNFIEKFCNALGLSYNSHNISMVEDVQNKTVILQYAFDAEEIEGAADKLSGFNIAHQIKDGVGVRFLELASYEHKRTQALNQERLEEQMLEELYLATGVEWTIRDNDGARSYMPIKPVPKAYGALLVLCDKNALNIPECIPERFTSGAGMIRIPVDAVAFENFQGLKGKDLSATFAPPKKGLQGS